MKRILLGVSFLIFNFSTVLAQALPTGQEYRVDSTVRYTKTIEPNRLDASDSVDSKTGLDRRFFGDFNARVEYLLEPPFKLTTGLRIYKMPGDTSFVFEVKKVSNYEEVNEQLRKEFPTIGVSAEVFFSMSPEEHARILAHNTEMYNKTASERLKRYTIEAKSTPISDSLADRLYDKTVGLLRSALPVGKTPGIIFDGEVMIFRCVVDDNELWTLRYHVPVGEFKALSDLFRQIIADVEAGTFDEDKYIRQLGIN